MAVDLEGIVKVYGATRAVDSASLVLREGRVHAIVGENGAGKSTLLKIAAGVVVADRGSVRIDGKELEPKTPREAIRRGVGMVHQHFMLVPTLTGLENLALGEEVSRFGFLDLAPLEKRVRERAEQLSMPVRLDVPVSELGVGERQRLEIVRVLSRGAKVLILDEPTAVLAPSEARAVLGLARKLAEEGAAVALVTHHLDEVVAFADEVTVLRRGRVVAHHDGDDPALRDERALAREALGEVPSHTARRPQAESKMEPTLSLESVSVDLEGDALRNFTLSLRPGEIVGIAGVEGNGQRPLELGLAGLVPVAGGIVLGARDVTKDDVRARRRGGLAWIPSDRHTHGIADELPVEDVLRLGALDEVTKGIFVDEQALLRAHEGAVAAFDLRPKEPSMPAGALSGGNQQKLVVARELRGEPRVILAAQPTRGVDARAAALIRARLVEMAERGAAVLLVSSDLQELREIADRIVVLRGGRIAAELPPSAEVDAIGAAMLGATRSEAST